MRSRVRILNEASFTPIATRLDRNFSNLIFQGRAHKKCHISKIKRAIALKFERQIVQRSCNDIVLRSQFSRKIDYAGFSHRRSHIIEGEVISYPDLAWVITTANVVCKC